MSTADLIAAGTAAGLAPAFVTRGLRTLSLRWGVIDVPSERMETLECGSTVITGSDPDKMVRSVEMVRALGVGWTPPQEYLNPHVSRTVARIVLGPAPASVPV